MAWWQMISDNYETSDELRESLRLRESVERLVAEMEDIKKRVASLEAHLLRRSEGYPRG